MKSLWSINVKKFIVCIFLLLVFLEICLMKRCNKMVEMFIIVLRIFIIGKNKGVFCLWIWFLNLLLIKYVVYDVDVFNVMCWEFL